MHYFIDPFGCVKNQVDAENMMAYLNKAGWESSPAVETADIIIVNSCGFIESAKQESINAVLEWRKLYPGKKILLAGCLAQRYKNELSEILPEADGFFGVENIAEITKKIRDWELGTEERGLLFDSLPNDEKALSKIEDDHTSIPILTGMRPLLSLPGSAYVKISEGCGNNCSYCAIPLIRGGLVSREILDIVEECQMLLDRGIVELCLIAQDTGSFGTDTGTTSKLPQLLKAISLLKGQFWVRLLYIHPDHFPLQILDIMEKDPRFLPYFDIPFQHASPKILSAMNRRGSAEKYIELLETIRRQLPWAVIRSTFLLGFPGETEEDFSALLDFQRKAALDWLGCFTYSREEGTAAYSMKGRVPAKTAAERKRIIEERQVPITEKNMDRFVGETLDVLIEEQLALDDEDGKSFTLGRLYCQTPEIDGAAVIANCGTGREIPSEGTLVPCRVIARRGFDLEVKI